MPIPLPTPSVEGASDEEDPAVSGRFPALCVHCLEEGTTTTSTADFPGFRDGLMMWEFVCQTCNHRSKQVEFVGQYGAKGILYRLSVSGPPDLDRLVIKGENATISIPELEFEILGSNTPCSGLTRGDATTVREVLEASIANLMMNQHERPPETAEAINNFLEELKQYLTGDISFTFVLDDPSGNSFISTRVGENRAEGLSIESYERAAMLGLVGPVVGEVESELETVAEEDEEHVEA